MSGLEIILLAAFVAVVIAVIMATKKHIEELSWWEETVHLHRKARYAYADAAQDLDKQVSDLVYESQFKRDYQKEIADCLSIIDDADADMAMMHTNITKCLWNNRRCNMSGTGRIRNLSKSMPTTPSPKSATNARCGCRRKRFW